MISTSKPDAPIAQPGWPWPDELDALDAAPEYHTLLLENERVRVIATRVPPGHRTPVHTHRWPAVLHVMSWSPFVRCDAEGRVLVDTRGLESPPAPGAILWAAPLPPHTFENAGQVESYMIHVELKD